MSIRRHGTGHALSSREMAILLAVADEGSIRRAAQHLGLTPAAISKSVRMVEARLGASLYQRTAGGMVVTEPGSRLLDSGRHALLRLSAAEADFRSQTGQLSGHVRIGSGPIPAASLARTLVPEAKRRLPGLRLSVELGTAEELVAGLQRGKLDLAICHIEDVVLPAGLHSHMIQRLHAVIMARTQHPLAAVPALPASSLAGYALATFHPYKRFLAWYREQVGTEAEFGFIGPDYDLLAEAVAGSDLLLLCSEVQAETLARSHGLVQLDIAGERFFHVVHMIQPDAPTAAVQAVAHLADETLRREEG
jgi:DNA-binding transcriptional LysR family regulator